MEETAGDFAKAIARRCPILHLSISSRVAVSAKACMQKMNSSPAMLSPCCTPMVYGISHLAFPTCSLTFTSAYIRLTASSSLGGTPYLSRMLKRSSWLTVSNALTRSTKSAHVAWKVVVLSGRAEGGS
jgi:hypothetical protein